MAEVWDWMLCFGYHRERTHHLLESSFRHRLWSNRQYWLWRYEHNAQSLRRHWNNRWFWHWRYVENAFMVWVVRRNRSCFSTVQRNLDAMFAWPPKPVDPTFNSSVALFSLSICSLLAGRQRLRGFLLEIRRTRTTDRTYH